MSDSALTFTEILRPMTFLLRPNGITQGDCGYCIRPTVGKESSSAAGFGLVVHTRMLMTLLTMQVKLLEGGNDAKSHGAVLRAMPVMLYKSIKGAPAIDD